MAANKVFETNASVSVAIPTGLLSGAPVVLQGTQRAVRGAARGLPGILDTDSSDPNGTAYPLVAIDLTGGFTLPVLAESGESPVVNSAVAVGDLLYANVNTGTYDATTGIFYGFTIDKNQSGVPFGVALGTVPAGTTASIPVMLIRS